MTSTHNDIASLQQQLAEARENLRLIEERIAQYVQETEVPLQLIRDERHWRTRIAELEQVLAGTADKEQTWEARSPTGKEQPHRRSLAGRRRVLLLGAVGAVAVIGLLVVLSQTRTSCDSEPVNYDFETGSNEGWDVRYEDDRRLGIEAWPDTAQHCGTGRYALAFRFAQTADKPTAQVKLEATHLRLNDKLSAWVYVPPDLPPDVQANCFVLEDNRTRRWADKPDWPWYQTNNRSLKSSAWTLVECRATDFVPKQFAGMHWDDPLLLGFEFTRANSQPMEGTVYLDKIIVR